MNNDIIKLLNLEDDCIITSVNISDRQTKVVSLAKKTEEKYCPNAVVAVDSFHVVHWIVNEIHKYIRAVTRQYLKRDQELHEQREAAAMRELTMHQSDEVYILKKYSWIVLTNQDNIDYSQEMKIDSHFRYFMTLYEKEEKLFNLVPELQEMRDLKEFYIRFNHATSMSSRRLRLH